jgi:hypothetical protein
MSCRVVIVCLLAGFAGFEASLGQEVQPVSSPCPPDKIVYHDVITHRCKLVPQTKQIKKTVYEVKEVPLCLTKLPPLLSLLHHQCCDECPECECPRYKRVLLKKEVVCAEVCEMKCVVEEIVERVPCRACASCPHCAK